MELYKHQTKALNDTKCFDNVLYALDMGLGKTYIASEQATKNYKSNCIIVACQKVKIEDWINHFNDNYDYEVFDLTNKKSYDKFFSYQLKKVGVINYDLIWRKKEFLNLFDYSLICDESSLLQNETAKRTKYIVSLTPKHYILCSGTVVNGCYEKLYAQLQMLGIKYNKFGFYRNFIITKRIKVKDKRRRFRQVSIVIGYKNVDKLKDMLKNNGAIFMKTEEAYDMPKQNLIVKHCKKPNAYTKFEENGKVEINGKVLETDYKLPERIIYRQLAGCYNKHKLDLFEDLINSSSDRFVVFYNYVEDVKVLYEIAKKNNKSVAYVNGKGNRLKNFYDNDDCVLFVQYQSGSFGLNLQQANKTIFFSLPDGNAEYFIQALKRTHRLGQDKPCFYYVLNTENSIDEEIWQTIKSKEKRIDYLFK